MIWLPGVSALELIDVFDRGAPNSERVMILVKEATEMGQYALLAGWAQPSATELAAVPINDNFFWFGNGRVNVGEVLFVYTGAGQPRRTTIAGSDQVAYVLHWGKPRTMFANTSVVPILVRIGDVSVGQKVLDKPQTAFLR